MKLLAFVTNNEGRRGQHGRIFTAKMEELRVKLGTAAVYTILHPGEDGDRSLPDRERRVRESRNGPRQAGDADG